MIPEPDNDWEKPWVFRNMMRSAEQRCVNVGESERLLGYTDNCKMYRDMAVEFRNLDNWVLQQQIWQLQLPLIRLLRGGHSYRTFLSLSG